MENDNIDENVEYISGAYVVGTTLVIIDGATVTNRTLEIMS